MKSTDNRRRVVMCAAATALLLQMPSLGANDNDDDRGSAQRNRPIQVTFTKWRVNPTVVLPQFTGKARGRAAGVFFAEVLQVQSTAFSSLRNSLTRLEAVYEVQTEACVLAPEVCGRNGDRSFTALLRGGQDVAASGRLDGVVLAGWRTGARVHAEFERHIPLTPADFACEDAPIGTTCFEGTLRIEGL
jgi:hypothetical protein